MVLNILANFLFNYLWLLNLLLFNFEAGLLLQVK